MFEASEHGSRTRNQHSGNATRTGASCASTAAVGRGRIVDALLYRIGSLAGWKVHTELAYTLALEAERRGLKIELDAVLVHGEAADDLDRQTCRRVFGAKIIDLYSSKEGMHMAYRCPSHGCWHVNDETLLLEIVDENGRPCAAGQMGRVVITPFLSYAQPLIRYDHGDLAVAGLPCECGRTLRTLQEISGRVRHLFRHPDGRSIAHNFPDIYRETLGAGPWQFVQVGALEFEIRYVPLAWEVTGNEDAVAEAFRKLFFNDAVVRFKRMREIPLTKTGKFIEYLNELKP